MANKKAEQRDFESSGLPESYRAQWEANPYAGQTAGGIGAEARKAREELNINSREYYANLLSQAHSEDFNSAEAQVERLKAAGINPDLAGGVSPGDSTLNPVKQSGVEFAGSNSESILAYSDILLNIASLAMSLPAGLQSLRNEKQEAGLQLTEAADALAKAFPKESKNIAPSGSGLAPVLVDSSVSAERIAENVPNLSRKQQKQLAKSIDLHRSSLRSSLSSAKDRYELQSVVNELSLSGEAKSILSLEKKLTLAQLKGKLTAELELNKHREEMARKAAENEKRGLDVAGEKLDAESAEAKARQSVAGAQAAEAGLRSEIARNTDGKAIGEANTEAAILHKAEAEAAQEQLEIISEAEDENLFTSSLIGDVLTLKIGTGHEKDDIGEIVQRFNKRRRAKREQKRKYKQSAGSGTISISPKGVSYSE